MIDGSPTARLERWYLTHDPADVDGSPGRADYFGRRMGRPVDREDPPNALALALGVSVVQPVPEPRAIGRDPP
jgi:hypothetical protein